MNEVGFVQRRPLAASKTIVAAELCCDSNGVVSCNDCDSGSESGGEVAVCSAMSTSADGYFASDKTTSNSAATNPICLSSTTTPGLPSERMTTKAQSSVCSSSASLALSQNPSSNCLTGTHTGECSKSNSTSDVPAMSTLCSLPGPEIPDDELEILAKMEEQNKMIEQDLKSVSGSTKKSDSDSTSQVSENLHVQQSLSDDLQEDLWTIWSQIVHNWDQEYVKKPHYVKELARRGIPSHFRTIAWQLLSGANVEAIHDQYVDCMRNPSPHEKMIKRDISRTYPEHEFFRETGRGQQCLFNVMKAYSLHDREVGYCQGSAFIAGLLLLQMPEEEAFAVLLRLMDEYGLRELYKPQMTQLGLCMFQLESLVQELMPDVHMHFQNMAFDASMYSSSWFLTLFSTQLPLELVNRIMDLFLCEGMEVVFRVGIAMLQLCRYELLTLDMEGMLRFFQREIAQKFESDYDLLFTTAYQVKYNAKKMKKLEKDYLAKRTKEQEEAVELRRLRTENRLLRQRVENLEQESVALAERLLQGQVNFAVEAEQCINVRHELHSLRDLNSSANKRLEQAYETIRELSNKAREGISDAEAQVDDCDMINTIHQLQQDLIETKSREADNEGVCRELRLRINELENANKRLREIPPDHAVAALQEELISIKMRDAEATLSLKEMRQKLADLELQWEKYVAFVAETQSLEAQATTAAAAQNANNNASASPPVESSKKSRLSTLMANGSAWISSSASGQGGDANSNGAVTAASPSVKELQDILMGVRIAEAEAVAELKEMRQKVMELETQSHVCTNQIRRQDEDYKRLQADYDEVTGREKEAVLQLKDEQHKVHELEVQLKEQSVLSRLKETELLETVTELRSRLSDLESRNYERWTQDQLNRTNLEMSGHLKDTKAQAALDHDLMIESPTSLTNSIHSADALSICSEFDLNACVAEMALKVSTVDGFTFVPNSPTVPNGFGAFSSHGIALKPNNAATSSNSSKSCNGSVDVCVDELSSDATASLSSKPNHVNGISSEENGVTDSVEESKVT